MRFFLPSLSAAAPIDFAQGKYKAAKQNRLQVYMDKEHVFLNLKAQNF